MKFMPYLPPKMSGRPLEHQGPDYPMIREALMRHPGMWAEIPTGGWGLDAPNNFAHRVRTGQMGFVPQGAYDAAVRGGKLYLRYNKERG